MKDITYLNDLLARVDCIIFDLGGVIVNIDYLKTQQYFEDLGLTCFGEVYSQAAQTGLFDLYEKGLTDSATFRDKLRRFAPDFKVSNEELDKAWNAMILDLPSIRLDVLYGLKSRFRTFLLSNTNEIHIDCFHSQLKDSFGKDDLSDYFEKVYYSYQIRLRKPDKEIFRYVLNENGLDAKRTLFIDDTIRHIESAKSLGIECLHVGSDVTLHTLYECLSAYGKA